MVSKQQSIARKMKIVIVGASTVGKTSLMKRFQDGSFSLSLRSSYGLSDIHKKIQINDKDIDLNVWDTVGQELLAPVNKLYYKQADGAIIVFDVTNRQTFNEIEARWIKDLADNTPPHLKKLLVGNKIDLGSERKVRTKEGQELARKLDMDYIETSAKEGTDVETIFFAVASKILEDKTIAPSSLKGSDALLLQPQPAKKQKSKCC